MKKNNLCRTYVSHARNLNFARTDFEPSDVAQRLREFEKEEELKRAKRDEL